MKTRAAQEAERALLSDPDRDWVNADEAAKRCDMWPQAIRDQIRCGELRGEKVGRHWHIPRQDVEELRQKMRRQRRPVMPTPAETASRRQRVRDLHRCEITVSAMAKQLGVDRSTIDNDHKVLGITPHMARRPPRKLTPQQLVKLPQLLLDKTLAEIAAEFGVSPGYIRNERDRLVLPPRSPGTRPKYPVPEERPCAQCQTIFTPARSAGDRRFCSVACSEAGIRHAFAELLADRQAPDGPALLSTEVAAQLRVGLGSVYAYVADAGCDLSPAERVEILGRSVLVFHQADVDRFERERARGEGSEDGRRTRWVDPDKTVAHHEAMGWLQAEADRTNVPMTTVELVLRARVAERAKRRGARRRGRRPQPTPDYHLHWLERYVHHRAELLEAHEWECDEAVAAGQPLPERLSDIRICTAVAVEDWREFPERWPRDRYPPGRFPNEDAMRGVDEKQAAKRVWGAIKPLLSAVTGNEAG
jgi:hypothetical protein